MEEINSENLSDFFNLIGSQKKKVVEEKKIISEVQNESLEDLFVSISEEKKRLNDKKKEIIGEITLDNLFSSLEEEKRKSKQNEERKKLEIEKLRRESKVFETFLFGNNSKKKKEDIVEVIEEKNDYEYVNELERKIVKLKNHSYNSIDKLMKSISKKYNITTRVLHDDFKEKHGMIPDEWVKNQLPKEEVEKNLEENLQKSIDILDKLVPEEEKINDSETEISRLKREVDQLRKMVYESVRTATAQGGGGEVRLEFLDDVDRNTAKTDGFYLKYDETLDKWVGAPVGGGATTFIGLTDVDSSTQNGQSVIYDPDFGKFIGTDILGNFRELISENVSDGDVVVYSASAGRFIATSQENLTGVGRTTLSSLDDVDVTGISTNHVLIFNGTDFEFTTPFEIMDRSDGVDDDTLDYGSF